MIKKIINIISKYYAVIRVNCLNTTAYKIEFICMALRNLFMLLVFIELYQATFNVATVSQVGNLSLQQTLWLLIIIRMLGQDWSTIMLVNNEIKSGDLIYIANRPYSYIMFHYASYWGRFLPKVTVDIISNFIPALILIGPIYFSYNTIFPLFLMCILGLSLEFLIQMTVGLATFWMQDVTALKLIISKAEIILGGMLIPIAMFPKKLRIILEFLPFTSIYYNLAHLAVKFDTNLFIKSILLQIFWIIITGLFVKYIYNKGMKNVSISGG